MFDKEAEEYVNEHSEYNETFDMVLINSDTKKTFKDAAEFGYNKANEWHYVKDGDLPKNNMHVLALLKNKRLKITIFMENKFTIWNKDYDTYTKLYDVIAWKEIILPKVEE